MEVRFLIIRTQSGKPKPELTQCYYWIKNGNTVLASAARILKLERYREDLHGPCARMTRKFVKRSIFFNTYIWNL